MEISQNVAVVLIPIAEIERIENEGRVARAA